MSVQVEVFRFYPSLHTIAADADGDIALQYNSLRTGIVVGGMHLLIKVELYEIPEVKFLLHTRLLRQILHGSFLWPLREDGGAIEIAIVAEGSIGHEPILVLFKERLILYRLHGLRTLLGKDVAQIAHLGRHHPLIVNLCQGVQFLT